MDDCCIIINPEAGGARKQNITAQILKAARGASVHVTSAPGEATELARRAARSGFRTVVAAGGDGTVNEVVRGIAKTDCRLGVLPLGTMNVFARELRLPLDWDQAWALIRKQQERRVDIGWFNSAPMVQLAGIGFDAEVVQSVSRARKRALGPLAYILEALRLMPSRRTSIRVNADTLTGVIEHEAVWVLAGTGRYYGGPFPVFPGGCNTGGLLNVLVIEKLSAALCALSALSLPIGRHISLAGVHYFQTKSVTVDGEAPFEIDGEFRGHTPAEIRIAPRALRVLS